MPLYEYECRNCKIRFERVQRMVDASLTLCPECGENALARVIQPVGVIFKGSGFYVTDNRSRSSTGPSAAKAESGKDAGKEPAAPRRMKKQSAARPSLPPAESSCKKEPHGRRHKACVRRSYGNFNLQLKTPAGLYHLLLIISDIRSQTAVQTLPIVTVQNMLHRFHILGDAAGQDLGAITIDGIPGLRRLDAEAHEAGGKFPHDELEVRLLAPHLDIPTH